MTTDQGVRAAQSDHEIAPPTRRGGRRGDTIALAFFLVLAVALFASGWFSSDRWIGGHGDEVLESWYLGWVPWAIVHGHNPLVTTYMNYPAGLNVMWNTSVPLLGIAGAPILALFGPRVEYHAWLTAGVALSAFLTYLFARRRAGVIPSLVAGLVYGFSPFIVAQALGHLHESFAVTPPLLLMLFDDLLVRRTRSPVRSGVYLGILAAAQLLIGEEILATAVVVTPIALVLLAILHRNGIAEGARRLATALMVAAPVALVLCAYPLYVQFRGPQRLSGPVQPPNVYVSDLLNLIVPNGEYFTPPRASGIAVHWTGLAESTAYLSLPGLLLLGALLVALRRQRIVWFFAAMVATVFVLSLGPHLHVDGRNTGILLPWAVIDRLPVLQSMLPARFSLYMYLFAGLLLAVGLNAALEVRRWGVITAAAAALTLATLAALFPLAPSPVEPHDVPPFFTSSAVGRITPGGVALVAPWSDGHFDPSTGTDTVPMLWQVYADFRFHTPSGYALVPAPNVATAFTSPAAGVIGPLMVGIWQAGGAPDLPAAERAAILQELRDWKVTSVVVGPMAHRSDMVAFLSRVLGRPGESISGVTLWTLRPS